MDFSTEKEMLEIAEDYFKENKYAESEPLLNQLVLNGSKRPEVFHMLGTIYYDQGKFNKAIRSFRRALEIDPGFTDSSIGLSIILNDLGRYEEGQKIFDEARAMLSVKGRSGDPQTNEKFASKHDELADLYVRHSRYEEAISQFQAAYKLTNMRRPEIGVKLAGSYIQLNNISAAIRELRTLLRDYPHYVPALLSLGKCYYDSQQIPEAVEQWERVLSHEPDNESAQNYLKLANTIQVTNIHTQQLDF